MIKLDYPPDVDMQSSNNDGDLLDWYPSQVKGPVDDEVQEGKLILIDKII